jgi:hypothetical protein
MSHFHLNSDILLDKEYDVKMELCPKVGFGISCNEPSGSIIRQQTVNKLKGI